MPLFRGAVARRSRPVKLPDPPSFSLEPPYCRTFSTTARAAASEARRGAPSDARTWLSSSWLG